MEPLYTLDDGWYLRNLEKVQCPGAAKGERKATQGRGWCLTCRVTCKGFIGRDGKAKEGEEGSREQLK